MQRIGLTGGIGAGKSVVSQRLVELGAVVIDADDLARAAVAPGTVGFDAVIEEFGPDVVDTDGTIDRAALAHLVFADAQARVRLEQIVHPEVRRLGAEREAAAAARDHQAVVVHDIPLLIETGQANRFELVVVVHAPAAQRLDRLVTLRHMDRDEAAARIAAQASDDDRLAAADVVLDSTGSAEDLIAQVDTLWSRLLDERTAEADPV
ncbi:MAG: dephospho-CoA kinase [Micrococcales bacterium]|nr:dephospho-CoA kinase [Micrococcales bacterium]MCL2667690.1 dephospho-CoA kinase [Micrococcales bacterium]